MINIAIVSFQLGRRHFFRVGTGIKYSVGFRVEVCWKFGKCREMSANQLMPGLHLACD